MTPRSPGTPPTEATRVARRLRRLSPGALRVARQAALLPQPFALSALAAEGPEAEERALTALQELVDRGLPLSEVAPDRFALAPALVAAITAPLLPALRARLGQGLRPSPAIPATPPEAPSAEPQRLDGAALIGAPTLPSPPPGALDGAALSEAPPDFDWSAAFSLR